jgi:hypothetical protein
VIDVRDESVVVHLSRPMTPQQFYQGAPGCAVRFLEKARFAVTYADALLPPADGRNWTTGNKWKFFLNDPCYGEVATYNTHPLVAGSPRNPFFKKLSKPFVWAPESS